MTTLIMTAKLNDVDPQAWLADVLGQIADIPQGRLAELLPWNWKQPNSASGRLICSCYAAVPGVGENVGQEGFDALVHRFPAVPPVSLALQL